MAIPDSFLPVTVPDGRCGDFSIQSFEMSEADSLSTMLRATIHKDPNIYAPPGLYTKLVSHHQDGRAEVVMSNTPMEYNTNLKFMQQAKGRVLINGLGLGLVLNSILQKPEVDEVWVIEKSADVIALVAPMFNGNPRVKLFHHDAFSFQPPEGIIFDVVWHDIWTYISSDNLKEMDALEALYKDRCEWQASWCRNECRRMRFR